VVSLLGLGVKPEIEGFRLSFYFSKVES